MYIVCIVYVHVFICYYFLYSVEIYGRMSTDLLPTPAKSHYVFNLRDLSKCVQGQCIPHSTCFNLNLRDCTYIVTTVHAYV